MPRTALQNGFHRVGLALGGILLVAGLAVALLFISEGALTGDPVLVAWVVGVPIVGAAIIYGLCRLAAWVTEGFGGTRTTPLPSTEFASMEAGPRRSTLVIAVEAILLVLVIGTVVYFVTVGLSDFRTYSNRLFAWWVAVILTAMSLWPLLRRRIVSGSWRRGFHRHRPLLEGDVGIVLWLQAVVFIAALGTWLFAGAALLKAKGSYNPEDAWLAIFIIALIYWPLLRHRLVHGFWKPSPYSPQRSR